MSLCPVCGEAMVQVEQAEVCAYSCPGCRGTWISAAALERRERIETASGAEPTAFAPLPELAEKVTSTDSKNALNCPVCKQIMTKERFHQRIPVTVDRCAPCNHIWLDAGEQEMLLTLYREMVAGAGGADPLQKQRLARLEQAQRPQTFVNTPTPQRDGTDVAFAVGMTVLEVVLDMFLSPRHGSRHRNYW